MNIFTRSLDDNLASLVKQVDKTVGKNKDKQLVAFVVLLTDDPGAAEGQLKEFSDQHGIENTPLTIFDGPAGPLNYNIARDAEVTVHLWVGRKEVRANHAFGKGKLNEEAIARIVGDTAKILD